MDRKTNIAWVGWMAVVLLALLARVAGAGNPVQSPISQLNQQIAVETVQGTVKNVGTFRLEGTSIRGVRLRLRTDAGKTVTVRTGPRSYLERQNIHFRRGDQVTVTGSPAQVGRRNVLVASQITVGDKTVTLRTREGKPLWNPDERKSSKEITGVKRLEYSEELRRAYEW